MRALDEAARAAGRPTLTVNTSCDGPLAKRIAVGLAGIARAVLAIAAAPRSLVHVHTASNGSFLRKSVVVVAASALHRPVLLHIHGGGFSDFATGGSALRRRWVSRVLRRADAIVVLNDSIRQLVAALAPTATVEIVPNPATMLCGQTSSPDARQILFLGRLGPAKGTDSLLEAIETLQNKGVDADYVVAGDGDIVCTRRTASRLPAPDRVRVPGWVSHESVHELLHQSSIFCLPSNFEGLPMALLQAMGHGLACVVTAVGGMGEIVTDGVNGLVVRQNDPSGLAASLQRLLDSRELRASLGATAHARILDEYAPGVVLARLEQIYATLIQA
jgi:glycosyltransferase involved in cell wall biosynthesis